MSLHTADEIAARVAAQGQAGHAHDCVTDPMDAYSINAYESSKAWGMPDSHATKAAYILGCSVLHAAHVLAKAVAPGAAWVRDGLESIAAAIVSHGEVTSAAIDVHSESVDRLAEATEARAP